MDNVAKTMKAKRLSFKKRRASIMKKTMEISVLCDVQACTIIVGTNGEVETWPENQNAVLKIISGYKDCLLAGDKKEMVKNDEKKLLNDQPWEWDDALFDGLSRESLEDLLKECDCDGDQNQNQVLNLHSWDGCLLHGLPMESLQELSRKVDSKLEAVAKRIGFLEMVDEQKQSNNKSKEIAVFDEDALKQNSQTLDGTSGATYLFEGEPSLQTIRDPNLFWFDDGSNFHSNTVLSSSILDVADSYSKQAEGFCGGAPEQSFFNMMPGMCPPHQFSISGMNFFGGSECPEQSILAMVQNRTGF